jgi:NAD(P)-dependent dehydrogenase (short-subunit alcohol dehydrogenase family)
VTEKFVKECNPATQVLPITVDVVDEAGVKNAFREIVARFGVPHVLINNAGALAPLESIVDSDLDSWWQTQVSFLSRWKLQLLHLREKNPTGCDSALTLRTCNKRKSTSKEHLLSQKLS